MDSTLRILALEPYYGGSHRAFLDGWAAPSRHRFTILGLPPYSWKWRMRHAAATFARMVDENCSQEDGPQSRERGDGPPWDLVFCSDMLNLPEFIGLARADLATCPRLIYFHENQLSYPHRPGSEDSRDLHFAFTNLLSAAAADAVWFNSGFHRDDFLCEAANLIQRFPDHAPDWVIPRIRERSAVHPPGIELSASKPSSRPPGSLRIVWAARWEHDKNPDLLESALLEIERSRIDFRISVVGESFREVPAAFSRIKERHHSRIERWGFQESHEDYERVLTESDIILSTADHEFFGISVLEGVAAGAFPLVPGRLAYPETLGVLSEAGYDIFHDGTATDLAAHVERLADRKSKTGSVWGHSTEAAQSVAAAFGWNRLAPAMDDALLRLTNAG